MIATLESVMFGLLCSLIGIFCVSQNPPKIENLPKTPIVIIESSKRLQINIVSNNYSDKQKVLLNQAISQIDKIWNSENFREKVISKKNYTNSMGRNGVEIYEHLMTGQELANPASINSMDFSVTMYYSRKNVVGYTYNSASVVYTNSKFYDKYGPCDVAKNLSHEWTHQLGYVHSTAKDSNSIPYSIGNIVYEICKNFN